MKANNKLAWIVSWISVGQVLLFLVLSIITVNWMFLMWSFIVAMSVGVPNLIRTYQEIKKEKNLDRK